MCFIEMIHIGGMIMVKQKKEGSPKRHSSLAVGIVFLADALLLAGGISSLILGVPVVLGAATVSVSLLLITKNLFDLKPTNKFGRNMYMLANLGLYATVGALMFVMGGPIALGATLAIGVAAHLARSDFKSINFSKHDLHATEDFLPSDDILTKKKGENKKINRDLDNTDLHTHEKNDNEIELNKIKQEDKLKPISFDNIKNNNSKKVPQNDRDMT